MSTIRYLQHRERIREERSLTERKQERTRKIKHEKGSDGEEGGGDLSIGDLLSLHFAGLAFPAEITKIQVLQYTIISISFAFLVSQYRWTYVMYESLSQTYLGS